MSGYITNLNRVNIGLTSSIFLNVASPTTLPRWKRSHHFGLLSSQPFHTHCPNLCFSPIQTTSSFFFQLHDFSLKVATFFFYQILILKHQKNGPFYITMEIRKFANKKKTELHFFATKQDHFFLQMYGQF